MFHAPEGLEPCGEELRTFVRNRYFYGKLLDVHHFESEQAYFNQKRWLLNRLVGGYGVVCGLDVGISEDGTRFYVEPGVALDAAGHEIVVPVRSKSLPLPLPPATDEPPPASVDGGAPAPAPTPAPTPPRDRPKDGARPEKGDDDCDDDRQWFHVCISWHECIGEPELVRVGSACDEQTAPCAPGSVRERYEISLREGRAPKVDWWCDIAELFSSGRLNYETLARHVTARCPQIPKDPCIALANLRLRDRGGHCAVDVDVSARPIVYTNDLLFELLLCAMAPSQHRPKSGKY